MCMNEITREAIKRAMVTREKLARTDPAVFLYYARLHHRQILCERFGQKVLAEAEKKYFYDHPETRGDDGHLKSNLIGSYHDEAIERYAGVLLTGIENGTDFRFDAFIYGVIQAISEIKQSNEMLAAVASPLQLRLF